MDATLTEERLQDYRKDAAHQAAVAGNDDIVTRWTNRLTALDDCADRNTTTEETAIHTGYGLALLQCIEDLRKLVEQPVACPELPTPPACWKLVGSWGRNGLRYVRRWMGQNWLVIVSVTGQLDGRRWAHVSASRRDRCPTWDEMVEIKRDFLGDIGAVQVAPPRAKHVNWHETCLHWWAPLEHWPLPDFTWGGSSI